MDVRKPLIFQVSSTTLDSTKADTLMTMTRDYDRFKIDRKS